MEKLFDEILATITNPDLSEAQKFARMQKIATALGLVADKHNIQVEQVWEIAKKHDADEKTPIFEPAHNEMTQEQKIFWDYIAELDVLG
jgi:hypothetical protein